MRLDVLRAHERNDEESCYWNQESCNIERKKCSNHHFDCIPAAVGAPATAAECLGCTDTEHYHVIEVSDEKATNGRPPQAQRSVEQHRHPSHLQENVQESFLAVEARLVAKDAD